MALFKRDAHWHLDVTLNGLRYREALDTSDHREAKAAAAKRVAEILAGKGTSKMGRDFARLPFGKAADVYLEERERQVSPKTQQFETQRLRPMRAYFGDTPLFRIKAADVAAYQKKRRSTVPAGRTVTVSGRAVNAEVGVLRRVMKRGKCWTAIAEDVTKERESGSVVGKVLSEAHKRLLFATATLKPGWLVAHCAAVLAASTTMRGVELKGLRWQNVDLFARTLSVLRSKTESGHRTLPLNDDALAALARLRERAEGEDAAEPSHFIFPACESGNIDPTKAQTSWRTAWRSLVKETAMLAGRAAAQEAIAAGRGWKAGIRAWRAAAGAVKGYRFHDLRHQCITEIAESGASDATLMALAGHMSTRMMEHYSHVRMDAKRAAVANLNRGGSLMGSRAMVEEMKPEGKVS